MGGRAARALCRVPTPSPPLFPAGLGSFGPEPTRRPALGRWTDSACPELRPRLARAPWCLLDRLQPARPYPLGSQRSRLDLALQSPDFRGGSAGGGASRGLYFFYLSLGIYQGLPPFSSPPLSPFIQYLALVQRERAGQTDTPSLHSFTSLGEIYCELGAGVLGSNRSSVTDTRCDMWQSPCPLWASVSLLQVIKIIL